MLCHDSRTVHVSTKKNNEKLIHLKKKIAKQCRKALQKLAKINYGDKRNGLYSFFLLTFETVG